MQFEQLIGSQISLLMPTVHKTQHQHFVLRGVEAGGLWLESQMLANYVLGQIGVASTPKTIAIFVPYHQFDAAFASLDLPSLNEKAFGV